jgi:hypothetical protein
MSPFDLRALQGSAGGVQFKKIARPLSCCDLCVARRRSCNRILGLVEIIEENTEENRGFLSVQKDLTPLATARIGRLHPDELEASTPSASFRKGTSEAFLHALNDLALPWPPVTGEAPSDGPQHHGDS